MSICHGCGGVIGRDCFNPRECEEITRSLATEYLEQPSIEAIRQKIQSLHKGESNDLVDKGWNEAIEHITKNVL